MTSKGQKNKVTGDYFTQALVESSVAYSKRLSSSSGERSDDDTTAAAGRARHTVRLRQWGLGEVVTAVAQAGLVVTQLVEEPGVKAQDAELPKLFTLVATKSL